MTIKKKVKKEILTNHSNKKIICYDCKTSGLNPAYSSILQLAAICVDSEFNEIGRIDLRGRMKKFWPWLSCKFFRVLLQITF